VQNPVPYFRFVELEREAPIAFVVIFIITCFDVLLTVLKLKKWLNKWCLYII